MSALSTALLYRASMIAIQNAHGQAGCLMWGPGEQQAAGAGITVHCCI